MIGQDEQYVVDAHGNRVKVLLDIAEYNRLLEALEDLDDLRAYDEARASGDEAILIERAVAEIERAR